MTLIRFLAALLFAITAPAALALQNGRDDADTPEANGVVRVVANLQGTGALISPRVVLTSMHLIAGRQRGTPHDDALAACPDWQVPGRWYAFTPGTTVAVGIGQSFEGMQVFRAVEYSMPGCTDMVALRLDRAVPTSLARPMQVYASAGAAEAAGDLDRLAGQTVGLVGWGGGASTRQAATATIAPLGDGNATSTPDRIRARGQGGATTELGDSGAPLVWRHPSGVRYVVGVNQQSSNIYVPTFRNATDGKPSIAAWIRDLVPEAVHCPGVLQRAPEGMVPLLSWWSGGLGDNRATTDPAWAGCSGMARGRDGYGFSRVEGYIYHPGLPQPTGTVKLFSWQDGERGDVVTTSEPSWIHWEGDGARRSPNYRAPRLEGYVYDPQRPQPAGTRPLYRWYSAGREDNWTTTQHAAEGRRGEGLGPDYVRPALLGYVR